ncbi:hypothetical protein DV737_g3994, partial [Chaetothyriales sp. CBS 132003]
MNGVKPTVAEMANMTTEERMAGMEHSEVRYFTSYDHHGIHEEMLKDEVRTKSYKDAIHQNQHLFKDKVVLDVGCGTGILSMFAARAGAKHVIGVDMSSIINKAKLIVERNGLTSKITLLQGKMEEVELPAHVIPDGKVDIIISEWMGYFLLYESMLDTVLYARDRYLRKGGKIFPDRATIYMGAIEDGEYKDEKIGFWDNVYGFDFTPMKATALAEPLVDTVELKAVVTDPCPVLVIDLNVVTTAELAFSQPFELRCRRNDLIHALIAWFDIDFTACHKPIRFSTGPHAKYTHWKQTVFYLREVLPVQEGECVRGFLSNKPNDKNRRDLDIKIDYELETDDPNRYARGAGFEYPREEVSWLKRDVLLFAVSIGSTADELHFTYELDPNFAVFPTYSILLPFKKTTQEVIDFYAAQSAVPIPGVPKLDYKRVLDGQRLIQFFKPLPTSSAGRHFEVRPKVLGVYDKGKAGTVVEMESLIVDRDSDEVYTRIVGSGFFVGQGGWGGPKGPATQTFPPPRGRENAPDKVVSVQLTNESAALYRLNGDYNPLHIDPKPGKVMGFGGVIMHGLFSWNSSAHEVLRALGGSRPENIKEFQARFAAPVKPGQRLDVEMWRTGEKDGDGFEEIRFVTKVNGKVVLSNGRALVRVVEGDKPAAKL